ncbi:MAG: type II secretion system F family protein [Candidatus Jorgensenbacteria bacterium]|nr:type II secretion system F family protein [Candidatus Jorgensenbacteria bacterium]
MKFRYIASQLDGRVVEGDLEARDVSEGLAFLAKNQLKPVSLKPVEEATKRSFALFRAKMTMTDLVFMSKYLSLMLKVGTGLLEAVNILAADLKKPAVRDILLEIRTTLEQGQPFYTTFAKYPRIFGSVYANLVKAGEASGDLERVFDDLTDNLTKQKDLRDRVQGALIYPILLLIGSMLILTFLVGFALPKIADVFLEGGFEPPLFSRVVFSVGLFFNDYGIYFLIVLAVIGAIGTRLYLSSAFFKKFVLGIFAEIPVIRDVVKKIALQRFASTLSSLIRAGMPITAALEITASAVGNVELNESLMRISREGLMKGLTVGEAFRREPFFPQTVASLMSISEKAGHLDEVLATLSDFYTKEIDTSVKSLVSFLEPILLVLIGSVIGVIALAIIVPIYQLTTQF